MSEHEAFVRALLAAAGLRPDENEIAHLVERVGPYRAIAEAQYRVADAAEEPGDLIFDVGRLGDPHAG